MTDKIFLIHDPARVDRRELYRQELITQGIDTVDIIPAVKDSSNPVKNISQAHKKCIRKAIELNLPRVIIMEDDVKFSCPGAFNRFLELSEALPKNWDIFISGSYDYQVADQFIKAKEIISISGLVNLNKFSGLHCYIVNQRYYNKMLSLPENRNLDKVISNSNASIWMCYPMVALQHSGFSDNICKEVDYNKTYSHRIKLWNPGE